MEDTSVIIWGLLFGAIGLGYLTYGRRQRAIVPLGVGITLVLFPYFISNLYLMLAVGVVLMVIPYFIRF